MNQSIQAPDKAVFQSPTQGTITFQEMLGAVAEYIKNKPADEYEIAIGTDSEQRVLTDDMVMVEYVLAITVRRLGNGGIFFYQRVREKQSADWPLRNRIYAETMHSATLAQEIRSHLRDTVAYDALSFGLQLHVDVGENGPTRRMIGEVLGIAGGYGFTGNAVKIKPDAYCAAAVADKYT